ncbi:TPA: hypothetical protein EYP66_11275 [Candidatus Poribacteria bacterium]|nr:hypothetical protein [Candidatus Poribacteria bacterium]
MVVGLIDLSARQKIAADVTGDGTVTALDVALILQYTVGLITQFPIQQGAPILTVKDENQLLTKIIAELEDVSLTAEQQHVLEQLKHLIGQQSIPSHTTLLQNYPNPFNPETWLPYKLAQDASVTIRIYKVKSLSMFGSYVCGEERKRSDLDLLVELDDDTLTLFKFIELEHYLSDLVGVKVDLVEKSGLKPRIGKRILEEVVPV